MDDLDDIVLDDYDSYLGDKNDGNSDDPLATSSSNNKKRNQHGDEDGDPENNSTPKKKRTKLKKLDHHVLMSPEGIPRLRNETPWLNFKDDRHAVENLEKLMRYYRSWAYKLYPRLNFSDFASRMLKVTASKECKEPLKRWREEYIFKNSGDTSLQDHTAGGLSGLTLEDEEKNTQNSDDKNDSSHDDNSDHDDDRQSTPFRAPTSRDEETQHNDKTDDDAWAAMMETDLDENDGALFLKPPVITTTAATTTTISAIDSTSNNNDLSVDDFFAD